MRMVQSKAGTAATKSVHQGLLPRGFMNHPRSFRVGWKKDTNPSSMRITWLKLTADFIITNSFNDQQISLKYMFMLFSNGFDQKTDLAVTGEHDIYMGKIKTNPFDSFILYIYAKECFPFSNNIKHNFFCQMRHTSKTIQNHPKQKRETTWSTTL